MKAKDIIVGILLLTIGFGCRSQQQPQPQIGVVTKVKGQKVHVVSITGHRYHTYTDRLSFGQKVIITTKTISEL